MVELKLKAATNEEQVPDNEIEAKIVQSVLGYRSGYIKGMGYGVKVSRPRESNSFAGIDLKKKLQELDTTKDKLINLTAAHTQQSEKMSKLERELAKMKQLFQHIPGISLDGFLGKYIAFYS